MLASIYDFVNTTHDPPPCWSDPQKFDARADDLASYYELYAETITEEVRRKSAPQRLEVRVVARCFSRTKANIYGSLQEAEGIAGALRHKEIPIRNHDLTDKPRIGTLRTGEATITRTTEDASEWQSHLVVVAGMAQEYP